MSPTHRTCLLSWTVTTLFLCAPCLVCLAGETGSPPVAIASSRPCVLLNNGNVIYGIARQQGEWILIENGEGNESRLPRQSVACWAASIEDLYQYQVDHRPSSDADSLVREAQWCVDHELYKQASDLLVAVQNIDPGNGLARLLDKQIRLRTADPEALSVPIPSIQTASHAEPKELAAVNLADLKSFASQVQPMLANRCGSCHSDPSDREWSLLLPPRGARPSSRMTRENLQRCIEMVDSESPGESILFTKAVTAHGGAAAPLDARDATAIESLRAWVHRVATSMVTSSNDASNNTKDAPTSLDTDSFDDTPDATSTHSEEDSGQAHQLPSISRLPQVANPFDPEIFNRKFHLTKPTPNASEATLPNSPINQ
jgi:hypothetical protein